MSKDMLQDKIRAAESYYEAAVRDAQNAKKELEELRKVASAEKYMSWIGKWGFYSDSNPACPDDGYIRRLRSYKADEKCSFDTDGQWRYFRPATPEELGCPGYDVLKEFVDRIATSISPNPLEYGLVMASLVNEARRIMKDMPNE